MRFCLSCGIAIAPDNGFSPITIRATRKVPRRKDPSENCWMHIMTALPSQLPPPQEQLLLHELNHRIGNEFCCAVVSLAAARSSDKEVKAVLTEVAELLHHYAEVHHALQMPEHGIRTDVAAYLRKLCLSIRRSKLNQRKIDLVLAACRLWLPSDRSWLLGMIVYELITNA